jgi:hypothetical protein
MTKRRFWLLVSAFLFLGFVLTGTLRAADPPQSQEPVIVIGENSTIRVTHGNSFFILLDASHFTKDALSNVTTPTINDLKAGSEQTTVTFSDATKIFSSDTQAIWKFKVTLTPSLAPNSSQARKAAVHLDKDYAKDYTLTNLPTGTVNWSVPPVPTAWTVNWSDRSQDNVLGFVVTAQDLPATNLRIASASFKDSTGSESFGAERLQLVEIPDSRNGDGRFALKARDTHTFYLRFKDDAPRNEGKFSGAVSFAIDERPELQTLQVTLNATSDLSRLYGLGLLAAGLLISWWTTARARPAIARLQAEKPVIALSAALEQFRKKLGSVPPVPGIAYPQMTKRIADLENMITITQLDDDSLLPSSFALSLGAVADSSAKLQARLADVSAQLLALSTILNNGILKIALEYSTVPQYKKDRAIAALPELDSVGATATSDTDANSKMAPVLAVYNAPPPNNVQLDFVPRGLVVEPVSVQEINYRIEHYSDAGWWIWGVVSVVVGCAILVVPNPGFGTSMDLILCFLWGLGVPTASAKLQELTPSGVGANIGVSVPKA